jgi:hypothetical protein
MIVVNVPDPAINGKAMGTTLPLLGLVSGLKKSTPRIISSPIIKITILPATAKDSTSSPSKDKNGCPKNRNRTIKTPEARVACIDLIWPPILSFREIKIGMEPKISITAKRVKVTVMICSIPIFPKFILISFDKNKREVLGIYQPELKEVL